MFFLSFFPVNNKLYINLRILTTDLCMFFFFPIFDSVDMHYKHYLNIFFVVVVLFQHFSDMTSLYSLNAAAPLKTAVKGASPPENCNNINRLYQDCKQNYQSSELLAKAQTSTGNIFNSYQNILYLKPSESLGTLKYLCSNH